MVCKSGGRLLVTVLVQSYVTVLHWKYSRSGRQSEEVMTFISRLSFCKHSQQAAQGQEWSVA